MSNDDKRRQAIEDAGRWLAIYLDVPGVGSERWAGLCEAAAEYLHDTFVSSAITPLGEPKAYMVERDSCDPPRLYLTENLARANAAEGVADTHIVPLYSARQIEAASSHVEPKNAEAQGLPAAAANPLPFESVSTSAAGMREAATSAQQPAASALPGNGNTPTERKPSAEASGKPGTEARQSPSVEPKETLDMSPEARLKDAQADVLRLHDEKMKFFERTIVLERELAECRADLFEEQSFAPSRSAPTDGKSPSSSIEERVGNEVGTLATLAGPLRDVEGQAGNTASMPKALSLAMQWTGRADDAGRLARAVVNESARSAMAVNYKAAAEYLRGSALAIDGVEPAAIAKVQEYYIERFESMAASDGGAHG